MRTRKPRRFAAAWPFWVGYLCSAVLVAQLLLGRQPLGLAGALVLLLTGVVLMAALGVSRISRVERILAAVSLGLASTVLVGVAAALSPQGLDARSVAVVELGLLAAAFLAWVVRGSGGRRPRVRSTGDVGPPPAGRGIAGAGTVLLVGLGLALAAVGYGIATRAAHAQDYGGFVQFWSTPAASGRPAEVGIGNQTRDVLACAIEITRPAHGGASVLIDAIQPGQPRLAALPVADASETEPWQLTLRCSGAAQPIERRLLIDPPHPASS